MNNDVEKARKNLIEMVKKAEPAVVAEYHLILTKWEDMRSKTGFGNLEIVMQNGKLNRTLRKESEMFRQVRVETNWRRT